MTRIRPFPALAALLLAGCASVPHVSPQVAQLTPASLGLDANALDPGADANTQIAADWWTEFGDPQLDRLIAMGLAGNPDLAGALARVRAADATLGAQRAANLPQVTLDGKVLRQRYPENYILPPPLGGSTFWVPQIEATLNWDLDLFGRNKAAISQGRANAAAATLDADAARLTLSTAIAQTYIGLAHAARQIIVADGFVQTRTRAVSLVQARVTSQLANDIDLRQAQMLLVAAQQARTRAVEQHDMIIHALAALVGRGPDFYGQIKAPTLAFDKPLVVPAMIPADLLGRRPDLLAGQARINAAMAGRQIAKAEFMPNISIQALAGTLALGLGNAFKIGSGEYGVGPAIHLPIFEGGRLKANYKGATAAVDEAVAAYDGTVLKSVRDAADAITHVEAADRDLADQSQIVKGLRETVRLNQVRVDTGLGSRLDAIDSGYRLLEAEQALVTLQAQSLTRRVQLIAALGGGFDPNMSRVAAASAVDPQL